MKFICLGYIDPAVFHGASQKDQDAMMDKCFAYDDTLVANGHFVGGHALEAPNSAMTLRHSNGRVDPSTYGL